MHKYRLKLLIWAHWCGPILTLILTIGGFWLAPAGQTQEPTEEATEKPTEEATEEPSEKPTEEATEEATEEPPSLGMFENITISPQFSPDPTIIRGVSGGSISAAKIAGREQSITGPCLGLVDEEPDHRLELTSFFNYLSIQVQSPQDTTLVIRGPGGSWCNDDFEGDKNPGIAGQWEKGIYEVWIGSYDREQYYPYTIEISGAPLLNPLGF